MYDGVYMTQMIRKSVETRDWLTTIEPRNVRSVMKRVVEEVTTIDQQVGTLYEEGSKKDQGSGTYTVHNVLCFQYFYHGCYNLSNQICQLEVKKYDIHLQTMIFTSRRGI